MFLTTSEDQWQKINLHPTSKKMTWVLFMYVLHSPPGITATLWNDAAILDYTLNTSVTYWIVSVMVTGFNSLITELKTELFNHWITEEFADAKWWHWMVWQWSKLFVCMPCLSLWNSLLQSEKSSLLNTFLVIYSSYLKNFPQFILCGYS